MLHLEFDCVTENEEHECDDDKGEHGNESYGSLHHQPLWNVLPHRTLVHVLLADCDVGDGEREQEACYNHYADLTTRNK
jgi:hypothetical protein